MLYSASNDHMVICWVIFISISRNNFLFKFIISKKKDIGSKKGTAYELQGHTSRIASVCLARQAQLLLSGGEDHVIVAWNMKWY